VQILFKLDAKTVQIDFGEYQFCNAGTDWRPEASYIQAGKTNNGASIA
jgi:hypothetical protein